MKTAQKTVRLLKQFSLDAPELGVIELSHRLQMDRASVHRLLQSLCGEGIVQQNERTRRYSLGPAIMDIAAVRAGWPGVADVARKHLNQLRDRTGEGAALSRTDGASAICVTMVECRNTVRVVYELGERIPLHCSASGLVLLSHLEPERRAALLAQPLERFTTCTVTDAGELEAECGRVRELDSAYAADTYLEGVRSVASPIRDAQGRVVAAVAISVPSARMPDPSIAEFRKNVLNCASAISDELSLKE
ncbi:IclR family transcriptional regulator [Bradyrhizobium mercantei]|uniref:IclR family transcriptional regulator n=1 Tax=Bradyrhizobium mercantei TaxID=1904807 RepID=UPI00097569A7|nr:IclR family transcriptional regulator [Bradyrhizobium mercantei]